MIEEILEKEEKRLEEFCKFHNFTTADVYTKHGGPHEDPNKAYVWAQLLLIRSIKTRLQNGK